MGLAESKPYDASANLPVEGFNCVNSGYEQRYRYTFPNGLTNECFNVATQQSCPSAELYTNDPKCLLPRAPTSDALKVPVNLNAPLPPSADACINAGYEQRYYVDVNGQLQSLCVNPTTLQFCQSVDFASDPKVCNVATTSQTLFNVKYNQIVS